MKLSLLKSWKVYKRFGQGEKFPHLTHPVPCKNTHTEREREREGKRKRERVSNKSPAFYISSCHKPGNCIGTAIRASKWYPSLTHVLYLLVVHAHILPTSLVSRFLQCSIACWARQRDQINTYTMGNNAPFHFELFQNRCLCSASMVGSH